MRACPGDKPPYMPAGLSQCTQEDIQRYEHFQFMYPPYQFQEKYMMRNRKGKLVPPPASVREILMGYEPEPTFNCWPAAARRRNLEAHEVARCALIGNSFHVGVVAWLVGHGLAHHGIFQSAPSVSALANPSSPHDFFLYKQVNKSTRPGLELVRYFMARQSHRRGPYQF